MLKHKKGPGSEFQGIAATTYETKESRELYALITVSDVPIAGLLMLGEGGWNIPSSSLPDHQKHLGPR